MSVVLDLGANIECNDKNLIDFAIMGSSLFKSLYPNEKAKVALLNIGSEEIKGNEVIKNTYQKMNQIHKNKEFDFKGYIEGNNLIVEGIDLLDNTPILDVKPYVVYCDSFPDAKSGYVDDVEKKGDHEQHVYGAERS